MEKLGMFARMVFALLFRGPRMLNAADRYLKAWNDHDIDAILAVSTFQKTATVFRFFQWTESRWAAFAFPSSYPDHWQNLGAAPTLKMAISWSRKSRPRSKTGSKRFSISKLTLLMPQRKSSRYTGATENRIRSSYFSTSCIRKSVLTLREKWKEARDGRD